MDIDKYAKKTTDSNYPIQAKVVRNYIKSVLNSNNVVAVKKATEFLMKPTVGHESRFSMIRSLDDNVALFQDEQSMAIIAYSLKKKDEVLFELICERFFPSGHLIKSPLNFARHVSKITDNGGITDFRFTTDWDDSITCFIYIGAYRSDEIGDYVMTDIDDVPKLTEFDRELDSAKKLVSITKPMRIDVGFVQMPTIIIRKNTNGTATCYGLSNSGATIPSTLSSKPFTVMKSNGTTLQLLEDDDMIGNNLNSVTDKSGHKIYKRTFVLFSNKGVDNPNDVFGNITITDGSTTVASGTVNSPKIQSSTTAYCIRLYVYI